MRKRTSIYLILFLVLAVAGLAAAKYKRCSYYQDWATQKACGSKHGEVIGWWLGWLPG